MVRIPISYIPKKLKKKDKKLLKKELKKSRRLYKKKKYYTRKRVKSFKSKVSPHIKNAMRIYNVKKIDSNNELSKKTGCTKSTLSKIIKKGAGAYFSSGSRPNQTAMSWGKARLASAITGGKSAAVDYYILEQGCNKKSKALKLAKKSRKKHGYGRRRRKSIKLYK